MTAEYSPYFGDEVTERLQRARDADVPAARNRPGSVVHARAFTSDDREALGWEAIRDAMAREGMVSLRGADEATIDKGAEILADFAPVQHYWDLFMADADRLRRYCTEAANAALPEGVVRVDPDSLTDSELREVQEFLDAQGVSPFSADALAGRLVPARLLVLRGASGKVAAVGYASMPHNDFSPFKGVAWVGLIAVDPQYRGMGFGKQVDAIANLLAVDELGAEATMEFVATDNAPSRGMLESCGLTQVMGRRVVIYSGSDVRLTR